VTAPHIPGHFVVRRLGLAMINVQYRHVIDGQMDAHLTTANTALQHSIVQ